MRDIRSSHYSFFYLVVWTANEKEHQGETAIFNEREELNKQWKLGVGRRWFVEVFSSLTHWRKKTNNSG